MKNEGQIYEIAYKTAQMQSEFRSGCFAFNHNVMRKAGMHSQSVP